MSISIQPNATDSILPLGLELHVVSMMFVSWKSIVQPLLPHSSVYRRQIASIHSVLLVLPQGPVIQSVDSAIQRTNRYSVDKCEQNILRHPPDNYLSTR